MILELLFSKNDLNQGNLNGFNVLYPNINQKDHKSYRQQKMTVLRINALGIHSTSLKKQLFIWRKKVH